MPKQPTKEYMKEWRKKNKEKIRAKNRGKTRADAKEIKGLDKVDKIGGLTLRDWIG